MEYLVAFGIVAAMTITPLPLPPSWLVLTYISLELDANPAGLDNPFLDEFHRLEGTRWPLEDCTADICICDNVLEHLPQPELQLDGLLVVVGELDLLPENVRQLRPPLGSRSSPARTLERQMKQLPPRGSLAEKNW